MIRIIQGDCRDVMATMDDASVDAIVTDPPYGLSFMGKGWDHGVPGVEFWEIARRVAKPGAYLLAFGGTRTFHRLAVAIEEAGWEIRDCVMWVYGSGFPKSHNGSWGGTALKPAWEPIIMARKPLAGTVAANAEKHGTGGLNINDCRIAVSDADARDVGREINRNVRQEGTSWGMNGEAAQSGICVVKPEGRWPANVIHDGSDEVLAGFPITTSGTGAIKRSSSKDSHGNDGAAFGAESRPTGPPIISYGGTGSAARFFYCAKADPADRNDGLDGLDGQVTDDGRKVPADNAYQRGKTLRKNHHPTVKPTELMRYLCRLVTPKGGTVLDPFMGSGSTLKAAELEDLSAIGIELEAEYCEIARRRISSDAPLFADITT